MSRVHLFAMSSMELFAIEGVAFNQSFRLLTFDAVVFKTCVYRFIYELYKAIILCGYRTIHPPASALANCDAGFMYMLFVIQICYKVLWHLAFK